LQNAAAKFPQPLPAHIRMITEGVAAFTPKDSTLRSAGAEVRSIWIEAGEHLRHGRYTEALTSLQRLDTIIVPKGSLRISADDIASRAPGLANIAMTSIAIRDQLALQVAMTEALARAGKPAPNMPPTQAQLKEYFATMRGDSGAALEAYTTYCNAYQVHPANAGAGADVAYSKTQIKMAGHNVTVGGPTSWADVAPPRRKVVSEGEHAGKVINDCEGFVAIAATLLGAAGFELSRYVTATAEDAKGAHALVVFRDPSGGTVVVSNSLIYGPEDNTHALLGRAWSDTPLAALPPTFYAGSSAAEAAGHAATRTGDTL
jgi:hypothetical protein